MRTNLFLVSAISIATLASCSQESELDQSIKSAMNSQIPIEFATYASSTTATRGAAVNSNDDFQGDVSTHGSFKVKALVNEGTFDPDTYTYYVTKNNSVDSLYGHQENTIRSYYATPKENTTAVDYFNFSQVTYNGTDWVNDNKMYWPNDSKIMYFAAYAPASTTFKMSNDANSSTPTFTESVDGNKTESYKYSFPYTVSDTIGEQEDLMYAMTKRDYLAPTERHKRNPDGSYSPDSYVTTGVDETNIEDPIHLHFKHALTQIAFTATKDADIDVYVKAITICNVYNSGTFTAKVLTDDDQADATTNTTVGEHESIGDLVDADKFGSWVVNHKGTWNLEDKDGISVTDNGNLIGKFFAADGGFSAMSNYKATLVSLTAPAPSGDNSIKIGDDPTNATSLTSTDDVLMLLPQTLTAWVPTTSTEPNYVGSYRNDTYANSSLGNGVYANPSMKNASRTLSYLAIDCEIYHKNISNQNAKIHNGLIFVPFDTNNIKYSTAAVDNPVADANAWLPGYKITYCLNFGGGYIVDEDDHDDIPEPGTIPDTETLTNRTITYTTSCDTWVDIDKDKELQEFDNGLQTTVPTNP